MVEEGMEKTFIGRFVVWWLRRHKWPHVISFWTPQGGEKMPPIIVIDRDGIIGRYHLEGRFE